MFLLKPAYVLASAFKPKLYLVLTSDTWFTKANLATLSQRTMMVPNKVTSISPTLRMDLFNLRDDQRHYGLEWIALISIVDHLVYH
jgi:hypothetical protein